MPVRNGADRPQPMAASGYPAVECRTVAGADPRPKSINENALRLITFVYRQPGHTATATQIAAALSTPDAVLHVNQVTAWNRKTAKAIYRRFHIEPPVDPQGQQRFWNVLFDGIPATPKDRDGHYYWVLRPHLAQALADEDMPPV